MKKTLIRIIAFACIAVITAGLLAGCSDNSGFIQISVGELSGKLPRDMRPTQSNYYDLYYTSLASSFGVVVLDAGKLEQLGESGDLTLDEYLDIFINTNNIDREDSGLYFNAKQNAYRFTYLISEDGESYTYHQSMLVGGDEAIYYVDISCAEDKASGYKDTFELWANSVRVN